MIFFNRVAVFGVGLIGASFALAMREKGLCKTVYGYGRKDQNLKAAKERKIIDDYSLDMKDVCEHSDLILLATPVGLFKDIINAVKGVLKKGMIVTDVGSVKGGLVYELESLMPEGVYYVGSHPIAGSDKSGIDNARADLFRNERCIVTPTENSDNDTLKKIAGLWEAVGGRIEFMDPLKHDEIYAAVSHLPHLIAYALVNSVDDFNAGCMEYAGKGFKDTTRIALSSPELWRDISISNKDNLISLIRIFRENLGAVEKMLNSKDAAGLGREFARAQASRKKLR